MALIAGEIEKGTWHRIAIKKNCGKWEELADAVVTINQARDLFVSGLGDMTQIKESDEHGDNTVQLFQMLKNPVNKRDPWFKGSGHDGSRRDRTPAPRAAVRVPTFKDIEEEAVRRATEALKQAFSTSGAA